MAEVFIERERHRGVVGNVYKGRVSKVLPGMQSAFVDIGLDRDGFLYVSDVVDTVEELERLEAEAEAEAEVEADRTRLVAQPEERTGDTGRGDRVRSKDRDRERGPDPKIEDLLKEGQEILVQVVQGASREQGRPHHVACHAAGSLLGLHADGRPHRGFPQDRRT